MITVLCPTYNEAEYIEKVLKFFINSSPSEKELLLIDGGSTDGTKNIINEWTNRYSNIHLLENENKYVPFALNIGIKNSNGDPIIRLDAHTEYANDYLEKIVETFEKTGADIVGGPMNAVGKTNFQIAVAQATSTVFGIGDSKIHKGKYKGESDHVYLGAWQRKLFDEIGYFDERLLRNQDDEFHYRARSLGKRIYLNPDIKSYYYPRSSLSKLIKQYFQYGLFKPIVLRKIKSEIKLRHLVPFIFVIYLLSLPLAYKFPYWLLPIILYFLVISWNVLRSKLNVKIKLYLFIIYPVIHISYGVGFMFGILKFIKNNLIQTKESKN
ncbi:MAG: glycosyltransferase family 2 protein [Ignavibacteria bacterium]|nr:MAG: glycosyltransferase family 2 protein [Ignavibacteria bacterium]